MQDFSLQHRYEDCRGGSQGCVLLSRLGILKKQIPGPLKPTGSTNSSEVWGLQAGNSKSECMK